MTLKVCVGSSCHLRGSYAVIEELKKLIDEYQVQYDVSLQASFCRGHCADGVCAKADDDFLTGLNAENVRTVFETEVLPRIAKK